MSRIRYSNWSNFSSEFGTELDLRHQQSQIRCHWSGCASSDKWYIHMAVKNRLGWTMSIVIRGCELPNRGGSPSFWVVESMIIIFSPHNWPIHDNGSGIYPKGPRQWLHHYTILGPKNKSYWPHWPITHISSIQALFQHNVGPAQIWPQLGHTTQQKTAKALLTLTNINVDASFIARILFHSPTALCNCLLLHLNWNSVSCLSHGSRNRRLFFCSFCVAPDFSQPAQPAMQHLPAF